MPPLWGWAGGTAAIVWRRCVGAGLAEAVPQRRRRDMFRENPDAERPELRRSVTARCRPRRGERDRPGRSRWRLADGLWLKPPPPFALSRPGWPDISPPAHGTPCQRATDDRRRIQTEVGTLHRQGDFRLPRPL